MFNQPPVNHSALHTCMCRVCQIVGLNNYDLSYNYFYYIVMKQNKIRPEWEADRERWFEMIQNVSPTQETTER